MLVTAKPDAIDFDQTLHTKHLHQREDGGVQVSSIGLTRLYGDWKGQPKGYLANFKPGTLDGHHLWRGTVGRPDWFQFRPAKNSNHNRDCYIDAFARTLFVSDEFASFLRDNKLRGAKPVPITERPLDWYMRLVEQRAPSKQ